MPANPVDLIYTLDGVVVTSPTDPTVSAAIRARVPDARSTGESELQTFFDDPTHAQAMLDERFAFLSKLDPAREGIEVDTDLGLTRGLAGMYAVPTARVIDDERTLDRVCRVRAFSHSMATGNYALELME